MGKDKKCDSFQKTPCRALPKAMTMKLRKVFLSMELETKFSWFEVCSDFEEEKVFVFQF
jgi:uncharacterized protein YdeI (YjbR/CyaY-like superfamily)